MKSPVSVPERVPGLVTHAGPATPPAAEPGGRNEQLREDRCATLRGNRPTWAVMGPGMSNTERFIADLEATPEVTTKAEEPT